MADSSGDFTSEAGSDSDTEPLAVPVDAPQPSQLYLNGRKLALVTQRFDFAEPKYDPLPVRKVDDRWMLTDGHTRAFVAHLAGADELRVVRDTDDLQMDVYRQCVEWCRDEDITEIGNLTGRVLNADDFETKWVRRCRAAAESGE